MSAQACCESRSILNPFQTRAQFRIKLEQEAKVEIRVFDGTGRLVRTLGRGIYGKGIHTIDWNGRTGIGIGLSSGIYYYHILVDNKLGQSGKIVKG